MATEITEEPQAADSIKPVLGEEGSLYGGWLKSIVSLLLYIGVYYMFFRNDIIWVFVVTAIVLLHELGHFIAMKYFGYKDVQMFFIPLLGAFVSGEPEVASQKQKVVTLFAGPLPGIVLGLIVFAVNAVYPLSSTTKTVALLLVGLNAFNLLPVKPLDGGQLLEKLLPRHWHLIQTFFLVLCAFGLFVWAVKTTHYPALLLSWFFIYRTRKIWVVFSIRNQLQKKAVTFDITYEQLSDEQYLAIRKIVIPKVYALRNIDAEEVDAEEEERVAIWVDKVLIRALQKDLSTVAVRVAIITWVLAVCGSVYMLCRYFSYLNIFNPIT